MDLISLTETEFFRKLTDGENDNLHIAYKDFCASRQQEQLADSI